MKQCTFLISALMLIFSSQYSYNQEQDIDFSYSLESQQNENEVVKKVVAPDRNSIQVSGFIDTLLVDRAYYAGLPTANILVCFEDEHTIKTTFYYVPVTLLDDITEKNAFSQMWENLQNICPEPTKKEYTDALETWKPFNKLFAEKFVLPEMQDAYAAMTQKGFDLLEEQDRYSDSEFVEKLNAMMVYNVVTFNPKDVYHTIPFYQQNDDLQEKVKDFIPLLQNIDKSICMITPTMINSAFATVKAMDLDFNVLFKQGKNILVVISPEIASFITDEFADECKTIFSVIIPKIIRGIVAINLGTTFEQYHAKREKEVDYLILEKAVQQGVPKELQQSDTVAFVVDEKTVAIVKLAEDPLTGEPIVKIECTTTV